MTGKSKIPAEKIAAIKKELEAGKPQNKISKKYGVSDGLVNKIAKEIRGEAGPAHSPPKNAIAARKAYAKHDRLQVLHKLMGVIDRVLDSPELRPGNLRDISIALGTTLDKFRLEENEDEDGRSGIDDLMDAIKEEAKEYEKSRTKAS
jgi:transposase-like protein